jgi:hypothetical protein
VQPNERVITYAKASDAAFIGGEQLRYVESVDLAAGAYTHSLFNST